MVRAWVRDRAADRLPVARIAMAKCVWERLIGTVRRECLGGYLSADTYLWRGAPAVNSFVLCGVLQSNPHAPGSPPARQSNVLDT